MNNSNLLNFFKMSALGNDFVIFDFRKSDFNFTTKQIKKISDRKNIGCDQLIIIRSPKNPIFFNPKTQENHKINLEMEIYNCDGSRTPACGNATRCVAGFIFEEQQDLKTIFIETLAGILECQKLADNLISVNMGKVKFLENFVFENYSFNSVDVGNPHAICFLNHAIDDETFFYLGPKIENHPNFPNKTNVEFAQIINNELIEVRVWERGVGETLACGSGACGVAVTAIKNNLVNSNNITVRFRGGKLKIQYLNNEAIMTGDYQKTFTGEISEKFIY